MGLFIGTLSLRSPFGGMTVTYSTIWVCNHLSCFGHVTRRANNHSCERSFSSGAVADQDLQIGGGVLVCHPDPEIRASVWSKNYRGPGPSPGSAAV